MASILAWIAANWMGVIVALLAIDKFLVQIFPNVTLFSTILGILQSLGGGQNPPAQ